MWGTSGAGGLGDRSPPVGSRGEAPVGGLGDEVPAEAEAILHFYMHNFDLILNYFCFARATSGWLMLRNGSCLSMK